MHRFLAFQSFPAVLTAVLLTACGGDSGGASSPPPPLPAATHFSVTAPASVNAGTAFNFTLTALDASNKVVAGYSGAVHFTSTDGQAVLPANSTLTNGTKTFSATLKSAGGQTITATDTAAPSITGTSSSIKIPGATHFSVTAPSAVTAGTAFNFTVTALDASNNPAPGYTGTARFTSTDSQAVLPANAALVNGTGLSARLKTAGGQTITATDTAATSITGTSSSIQVSASRFQTTASMGTARVSHTATLLSDGVVLITGGTNTNGVLSSAELFNSANGSFAPTGSMHTARQLHTATLLNTGKVLIAGGEDSASLQTAELFNPSTGAFAATGSMTIARKGHTATLLTSGKVLVTGGLDSAGNALATAELFDPGTGTFTAIKASMGTPRSYHAAILLTDGKVLITAGSARLATPELFDPGIETFTATGITEPARGFEAVISLNDGEVLVTGGYAGGRVSTPRANAELFDSLTGTFAPTDNMTTGRARQTETLRRDGTVLVAGGVVVIAPGGNCPLRCYPLLGATSSAELYDRGTQTFVRTDDMAFARETHTATLLNNGSVLITGGRDAGGNALATAELYQ